MVKHPTGFEFAVLRHFYLPHGQNLIFRLLTLLQLIWALSSYEKIDRKFSFLRFARIYYTTTILPYITNKKYKTADLLDFGITLSTFISFAVWLFVWVILDIENPYENKQIGLSFSAHSSGFSDGFSENLSTGIFKWVFWKPTADFQIFPNGFQNLKFQLNLPFPFFCWTTNRFSFYDWTTTNLGFVLLRKILKRERRIRTFFPKGKKTKRKSNEDYK